jgi:transitional endoplasmic reticulum ATPase
VSVRYRNFRPGEIDYAARKASQKALEQSVYEREVATRETSITTLEHYLWAIGETRRTVSDEVITEFEQDIELLGRL